MHVANGQVRVVLGGVWILALRTYLEPETAAVVDADDRGTRI